MPKKSINVVVIILFVVIAGFTGYSAGYSHLLNFERDGGGPTRNQVRIPVSITGIVVEKKDSEMTVIVGDPDRLKLKRPEGQKVILQTNKETRYLESSIGQSGIPVQVKVSSKKVEKNDFVSISALFDSNGVFTATCITVAQKPSGLNIRLSGAKGQGVASGTIVSIKEGGFILLNEAGERMDIETNSATKFVIAHKDKQPEEGSSADVVADRKVSTMGTRLADDRLQAEQVILTE